MPTTARPKTPAIKVVNREHWLQNCGELIAPHIQEIASRPVEDFFISVSLPTRRGLSLKKRTIGQCIPLAKKGKKSHLFISPVLGNQDQVAGVVAHELVHTLETGHGRAFGAIARPLGLGGLLTATEPTDEFFALVDAKGRTLRDRLARLGPYPHEAIDLSNRTPQATLMLKVMCPKCGCIARMTAKWIDEPGPPKCGCGRQMEVAAKRTKRVAC